MASDYEDYFKHISHRSRFSCWYRRYWLYPVICRYFHGNVLDVGCGIGDFLRYRSGTVGVDVNPYAVAYCQKQGMNSHLMKLDKLPFNTSEFCGANLDNVLEHIQQPMPLLGEIRRVLRPNGTLIVGVPGRKGFASDLDHKVYYDEVLLRKTVTQAGFQWQHKIIMPLFVNILDKQIRIFCLYGIFTRSDG